MNISEQELLQLIQGGEGLTLEFKESKTSVTRSVYETVCAFLNRHGGTILLGMEDSGHVQGIDPDAIEKIKKDFIANINNPQKLYPPAYLSIDELMIDSKMILRIYVPESSQVHRCNGRIYDRNGDSDLDITDYTIQVAHLYHRKQATYSENKVYPHIELNDLHREYTNAFPAKLIIEYGQVRTENANIPHGFGVLNPATLTPFPKNPVIGAFFREIHRADELGSGSRKLMRYGKIYGGADPVMIEGDVFRTTIKVPEYGGPNIITAEDGRPMVTEHSAIMITEQSAPRLALTSRQKEIITILQQTEEMSLNDINQQLQKPLANSTLRDNLATLKKLGIIDSRGRARATTWFLVKKP